MEDTPVRYALYFGEKFRGVEVESFVLSFGHGCYGRPLAAALRRWRCCELQAVDCSVVIARLDRATQ
jgi:hypothetical protein